MPGRRTALHAAGLALALLLAGKLATAQELTGDVDVIDASTLKIGGVEVRLHGIAAPAPGDHCEFRERTIDCGRVATTALLDLTAGARVRCTLRDAAGTPPAATCRADGYDLSEGMIYTGWARPTAAAPARYRSIEQDAQARRRGLWQGQFPSAVNVAADG